MTSISPSPLRILHVILKISPTNEQYNEHCLPVMHSRDITICTYFKSTLTPPAAITLYEGDGSVRGFFRAARAALKENEYDVIHVHTPHAGVLLILALLLCGLYRKQMAISVHTVHNSYQNFKLRHKLMFLPSFALYRRLVFCSHSAFESFPAFYKWLGGGRMGVVQNAVDLERIDRALKGEPSDNPSLFTIATVGLIRMKNPFTILEAFRQSDSLDSRLVYIGEGSLRPVLTRQVQAAGLHDRVQCTGLIEREQVFGVFAQSDVFVSASFGEGLPVAVLEAMACRCPVVLSDIAPHREIAEGVDFIPLVDPQDVAGFAREIEKIRALPAAQRAILGGQCRSLIEQRFSLLAMHAGYEKIYAQISGPRQPLSLRMMLD